jgi:hypothetical protein
MCPFRSYEESLIHFARAIYALRLDGGRCRTPGSPAGCGFYDPNHLYADPPVRTVSYGREGAAHTDGIGNSFGIDLVEVSLEPVANGRPVTIEFHGAPGGAAEFHVQVVQLFNSGVAPLLEARTDAKGHVSAVIPQIDRSARDRLGLIITRLDANDGADPIGAYTLSLRP